MGESRRGEMLVPKTARQAKCRSCGAAIWWTATDKHKPVPLSAATARTDESGQRFALTHFADCPHAAQHRRGAEANGETRPLLDAVRDLRVAGRRGAIEWAAGEALPTLRAVADDVFLSERARQDDMLRRIQRRGK